MDSFELNKIIGAILGTLLFVMGVGFIAEEIYAPTASGPGYALPAPEESGTGDAGPTEPVKVADIGTLLATADAKAGEATAKKCASCHDFTAGGPNKAGPNLYDIVGRPIAAHEGFNYSEALKAKSAETWTYENLNAWLLAPKAYAPGTKMSYAGDKDDADRANLIAYLATLSASPKPYPAPAAPEGGEQPTASEAVDTTSSAAPSGEAPASEAPASEAPAATSSEAPAPASSSEAPATSSEAPASVPAVDASSSSASM